MLLACILDVKDTFFSSWTLQFIHGRIESSRIIEICTLVNAYFTKVQMSTKKPYDDMIFIMLEAL